MRQSLAVHPTRAARLINLDLDWQQATGAAAGLAVATVALRSTRRPALIRTATATRESALVVALFALWQYAGSFTVVSPSGALDRARWIWRLERAVHLPTETWVQRLFLPHPLIIQFFNMYYDSLHFPVLIGCLIWLFVRHRDRYGQWLAALAAYTASCLLIQLVPVAPPRMLAGVGLVDTAMRYHQSVYASVGGFDPDQLSAMPSVHVGWALLVAAAVISTARSRWRWLMVLYPVTTTLAVVVTANHFWLDGIVAAAILVLVLRAQALGRRVVAARSRSAAASRASSAMADGVTGNTGELAGGRLVIDDNAEGASEDGRYNRQLR